MKQSTKTTITQTIGRWLLMLIVGAIIKKLTTPKATQSSSRKHVKNRAK